ncbi:hypothetical protein CMUS01_06775 [Colletotrichum musicola]|uniref:Secreted protein n=1 Tax=Colletotrichum musicola TaxID=2175873 RepID=A0A8H6KK48_9PEZI|nr:hypothetical protein CMUS01_06775 [Colletotrichum musicola]
MLPILVVSASTAPLLDASAACGWSDFARTKGATSCHGADGTLVDLVEGLRKRKSSTNLPEHVLRRPSLASRVRSARLQRTGARHADFPMCIPLERKPHASAPVERTP